jgi:hypothetical protein
MLVGAVPERPAIPAIGDALSPAGLPKKRNLFHDRLLAFSGQSD